MACPPRTSRYRRLRRCRITRFRRIIIIRNSNSNNRIRVTCLVNSLRRLSRSSSSHRGSTVMVGIIRIRTHRIPDQRLDRGTGRRSDDVDDACMHGPFIDARNEIGIGAGQRRIEIGIGYLKWVFLFPPASPRTNERKEKDVFWFPFFLIDLGTTFRSIIIITSHIRTHFPCPLSLSLYLTSKTDSPPMHSFMAMDDKHLFLLVFSFVVVFLAFLSPPVHTISPRLPRCPRHHASRPFKSSAVVVRACWRFYLSIYSFIAY